MMFTVPLRPLRAHAFRRTLTAVVLTIAATPAIAQSPQPIAAAKRGLVWNDRPSIVFGKDVSIDVRLKFQFEWRAFDPDINEETFEYGTRRIGLKGELTKHFNYEFERDILDEGEWKDVYVNWRTFKEAEVIGGRFKMPFSLEQLTGPSSIDFVSRSLAGSTIAPARDKGVMVHGRFFGRGLTYDVGVFNGDGDNGKLKGPQFIEPGAEEPDLGPSVAGRVTATVLRSLPVPDKLKSLRVGAAYTNANLPEGLNSLRGKSEYGTVTYFEPVYVKGRRQRVGTELVWTPGSAGIKAEWMQAREDRLQQSNRNEDLSDFLSTGWYVSGTWVVTGEKKDDDIVPKKALFRGGIGAIEVGARYDELGFSSASQEGKAFSNPRSDHLIGNKDQVWTMGVSWFPNRWVRLVGNAIHEEFEDPKRTPDPGTTSYWSGIFRLQIVF